MRNGEQGIEQVNGEWGMRNWKWGTGNGKQEWGMENWFMSKGNWQRGWGMGKGEWEMGMGNENGNEHEDDCYYMHRCICCEGDMHNCLRYCIWLLW